MLANTSCRTSNDYGASFIYVNKYLGDQRTKLNELRERKKVL